MKKSLIRIIILIVSAIAIIMAIGYSQKYLFRYLSSDHNRHALLNDFFKGRLKDDNMVVLGDSRTSFGVDTKAVKEASDYTGEIFNLSAPGQSVYEASYYYSMIKDGTNTVIQCTSPAFFANNEEHILLDRATVPMFLSGYRITDETKALVKNSHNFFDRHPLLNYFESRSYFKSYFYSIIRKTFDNEQFDESIKLDEYFPHIYSTDKHPGYPFYGYNCDFLKKTAAPVAQLAFLKEVKQHFKNKNMNYILVFMPINPDECKEYYQDYKEYAELIRKETDIRVIDLSEFVLDTDLYYDAVHLNKKGAKLFSTEVGRRLTADQTLELGQ